METLAITLASGFTLAALCILALGTRHAKRTYGLLGAIALTITLTGSGQTPEPPPAPCTPETPCAPISETVLPSHSAGIPA